MQRQVVSAAAFVVLLRHAFFACAIAAHRHPFPHGRHQFEVTKAKVTFADIKLVLLGLVGSHQLKVCERVIILPVVKQDI